MPRARALCALVALFAGACCKEQAYKEGDNVPLYVNTVSALILIQRARFPDFLEL
jgi:hypothetical protein